MVLKNIFKMIRRAFGLKNNLKRKKRGKPHRKHRRIKKASHKRTSKKIIRKHPKYSLKKQAKKRKVRLSRVTKKPPIKIIKIGIVTYYFPKVNAAVVKLNRSLQVGEPIWIKGKTTDFRQTVGSMQINRSPIDKARAGQEIGLEVFREVKPGDMVIKGN